jgi:hypothetical protein
MAAISHATPDAVLVPKISEVEQFERIGQRLLDMKADLKTHVWAMIETLIANAAAPSSVLTCPLGELLRHCVDEYRALAVAGVQADEAHAFRSCGAFIDCPSEEDRRDELVAHERGESVLLHAQPFDHEASERRISTAELRRGEPRALGKGLKPRPLRLCRAQP